jgi:hypothetical protein
VTGGEVRIGKELHAFQEVLKEWYFTCFSIGTFVFGVVYSLIWTVIKSILEDYRRQQAEEEPPCELDLDGDDDLNSEDLPSGQETSSQEHMERSGNNEQEYEPVNHELDGDDNAWEDLFYDSSGICLGETEPGVRDTTTQDASSS